jgi:hypothetical protein
MVMRDLDSLEKYDILLDEKEERDNNGKATSTEGLAAESD